MKKRGGYEINFLENMGEGRGRMTQLIFSEGRAGFNAQL